MKLDRLQYFQRKQIEAAQGNYSVSLTPGDLDALVQEIFRLRSIIRDVNEATDKAYCETWSRGKSR